MILLTVYQNILFIYIEVGKDAVYLKDININGSTIGFDKGSTVYNIELDEGNRPSRS